MNSYFFALVYSMGSLMAPPLGLADSAQPAGSKAAAQEPRYAAYC